MRLSRVCTLSANINEAEFFLNRNNKKFTFCDSRCCRRSPVASSRIILVQIPFAFQTHVSGNAIEMQQINGIHFK